MQILGVLILLGILAFLLIAAFYLSSTQKIHNQSESSLDDFYRSSGVGNVVDANKFIRRIPSTGAHRRHAREQHRKQRHGQPGLHDDVE